MADATKAVEHPYIARLNKDSPMIAGTRFPVRAVVNYVLKQGLSPEELVREFSHLTLAQIYDALSYYYDHREDIERDFAENSEDELRTS